MTRYRAHGHRHSDLQVPLDSHACWPPDSDPLDVVLQLLAALLESHNQQATRRDTAPQPMLTVAQAASLLGISRTTIIRKAEAGELPCVVVSRGHKKKMRRFPQSLIEDLALRAGGASETDL